MTNPKPPRDVHVHVILNSETPGDFRVEPAPLGSIPTGPNGELIFQNNGHNGLFVHFHLIDNTGLHYRFPRQPNRSDAIWSQLGNGACPNTGIWEVFDPRNISADRLELIVFNPNVDPTLGQFGYTLRVTKDDGAHYLPLDPGGDNQNGPISKYQWNTALVFVGGMVAGALATLGAQALLMQG
jgi:hypothetical protein